MSKHLQIKEGVLSARQHADWERANELGDAARAIERKSIAPIIRAGAAFRLLQLRAKHGEWIDTLAANSPHSRSAVWRWMCSCDAALATIQWPATERAYKILIAETQDDDDSRQLLTALNDVIAGKSVTQLQIEFGVRKPKALKSSTDTEEQSEKSSHELALQHLTAVHEGILALQKLGKHLDDDQWNQFAWAIYDGAGALLPKGWTWQLVTPRGPQAFSEYLAKQYGARRP